MTLRDELHALVDQLPEETLTYWLVTLKREVEVKPISLAEWLERADKLRAELKEKYGELPAAIDIINETREERLNSSFN